MKIVRHLGKSEVVVEDAPVPQPKRGEVLVRTAASALCGSEMSSYYKAGVADGNIGHEAAGVVVEIGEGVTQVAKGTRVGVSAIAGCGMCDYCAKGQYTWCNHFKFYGNMHAEYFVVAAHACHVIPQEVPWGAGVLITGDGLGVPYHTAQKIAGPENQSVVVFGLGPIGLGNVLMQKYLGRRVIGVDNSPTRLRLAQELGACDVIAANAVSDVPAEIRALTQERGADVCIEAAGIPATTRNCFAAVRKGGTVIFNGEQPALELSPSEDFIRRDITAKGSWFYHFSEYPAMLALFQKGLPVESLITHRFELNRAAEGYRVMAEGKSGKVLLEYPL